MMEKDKNKIDEIFKEGLSDAKFEFNESHWQDVESRLNRANQSKNKKIALFATLVTTSAAILALFFTWNNDGLQLNKSSDKINEPASAHKKETAEKEILAPSDAPFVAPQQEEQWISLQPREASVSRLQTIAEGTQGLRVQVVEFADVRHTLTRETSLNTVFSIPKMEYKVKALPSYRLKADPVEATGDRLAAIYQPKGGEEIVPLQKERSVVSFLAGPDLTSVKGAGKSSISENIGLAYSYPVTKGLSVSVGATYAKKNYKSAYKFYAPSNPPELTQLPSNVTAVCDVIDVPLTASYTVLKSKKVKFNVSAGLSSYFMLKEKYTFDYEGGGSYGGDKKSAVYEVNGENQHIFGVADFSISIEKKINDKINVGVKPFVKLPLTGIGYGNVDLESKGVAFTLGVSL
ncbi:outer membrane beta-barrel protein [Sphingobacterium sp. DR205]|uniref:outer membrane beta-barrel protein n=1 Tax=Sphingobacterium sp. DR205 TaxID=2713573 RepID=UPI0013E4E456|nr:outer membrane beta-barrel protein [Sphingobacterium sp. DR205]QIH35637.1 outer membrane beta-barrel protein [Sphingobacterium sp. DR205]